MIPVEFEARVGFMIYDLTRCPDLIGYGGKSLKAEVLKIVEDALEYWRHNEP